ncbi:toprim domain-containing protein, partial [Pseudomonas sp. 50_B]|uniref:toprim domain-containing protein n=1 Tax=Pseudomonas sp. 50_B TaxID=2813574 RepID=UPI001A9DCDD7
CLPVPERGLTKEDAEFYEIRSCVSTKDGKTIEATYFPYYSKSGELTGFKKRDWTVPKDHDFHFTVVGIVKINAQMFGQPQTTKGGRKLIIVEGEEEVPATRRASLESLRGTKYEGKIEPSVVSISMGTANAAESVAHNIEFVQSFSDIVLAFDSDSATPKELKKNILKGKEAKEEVASLLLSDNIYTITH